MSETTVELRASDAERQAAADRLSAALGEGRLTLTEYDERVQQAYAARTRSELEPLVHDLPAVAAAPVRERHPARRREHPHPARAHRPHHHHHHGSAPFLLSLGLFLTTIWGISDVASGHLQPFWPAWVVVPGVFFAFKRRMRGRRW